MEVYPGIYNSETGAAIQYGMARKDVEALLGEGTDRSSEYPPLDRQGRYLTSVTYGGGSPDEDSLYIQYANDRVREIHVAFYNNTLPWTTKEGAGGGDSLEKVDEIYRFETDPAASTAAPYTEAWTVSLSPDGCSLYLEGDPGQGLTSISIQPQEPGIRTKSDTFNETTPGLITTNIEFDYCLTLGMSTEEIGPRAGYADYIEGAEFLTDRYDGHYRYDHVDLLVFYDENGKAVQFITNGYGAFYRSGSGGSVSWRTPRGITFGSTLEEIQAQYPNVTTRQADYAWFGMLAPTKVTAALVREKDQQLVFWLKDDGVFGMGLSDPDVPLPNTGGVLS